MLDVANMFSDRDVEISHKWENLKTKQSRPHTMTARVEGHFKIVEA